MSLSVLLPVLSFLKTVVSEAVPILDVRCKGKKVLSEGTTLEPRTCMISGFGRGGNDICGLLGCYAA